MSGFVDLALERAFVYREHAPSEVIAIPSDLSPFEADQRFSMLEKLADYDDELMEQLLSDVAPTRDKVFQDLVAEFKQCQIVPVFFGSAEEGHGVNRLLKALRHETPFAQETAKRLGLGSAKSAAYIMKTHHTSHAGKLSLARVLAGQFADGGSVYAPDGEEKISGVYSVVGTDVKKLGPGTIGETVALGKLEVSRQERRSRAKNRTAVHQSVGSPEACVWSCDCGGRAKGRNQAHLRAQQAD